MSYALKNGPRCSLKQLRHFLIGDLREVFVKLANGLEILRHVHTDELIHFGSEPPTS